MSKVISIAEALQMENDTVVTAIKGTLKTLWKPKTGSSDKGDWSFQNGELTDGTDTIKVTFKDRDEVPQSMRGQQVFLLAYHGDRGWSGVKTKDEEYQGKSTRILWVTKTGTLELAGKRPLADGEAPGEPTEPTAPATRPAASPAPAPNVPRGTMAHDVVKDAKVFIARRASGMRIVLKAATYLREEYEAVGGQPMGDDQFQAICSTLFITGDRAGAFNALPVNLDYGTLLPKEKPATEAPVAEDGVQF